MSVETKELFATKKFPAWIKNHAVFKNHKQIAKIFPEIGLTNCEMEVDVDNAAEVKTAAKYLITDITAQITKRSTGLGKFAVKKADTIKPKRKAKMAKNQHLLNALKVKLVKSTSKVINTKNGKVTLNLPDDIVDEEKTVVFKSGERLISAYNKMNESLRDGKFVAMAKVETLASFKDFSSKNVPALKYKLVFSSDGVEGMWDIATMSMRGIQSCQTWGNGMSNDAHVVGSMVDPFTAIIYITSGAKYGEYGSKMIRRCVVRFVVNGHTKKPKLMLERMYPSYDKGTCDTFIAFLKEKTGNKYEVIQNCYGGGMGAGTATTYVPMSKIVAELDSAHTPYRDSGIVYQKDAFTETVADVIAATVTKVYNAIGSKFITVARATKMESVGASSKKAFSALRGTSYIEDRSYAVRANLSYPAVRTSLVSKDGMDLEIPTTIEALQTDLVALKTDLSARLLPVTKFAIARSLPKYFGKLDDELLVTLTSKVATRMSKLIDKEVAKLEELKLKKTDEIPIYSKY